LALKSKGDNDLKKSYYPKTVPIYPKNLDNAPISQSVMISKSSHEESKKKHAGFTTDKLIVKQDYV